MERKDPGEHLTAEVIGGQARQTAALVCGNDAGYRANAQRRSERHLLPDVHLQSSKDHSGIDCKIKIHGSRESWFRQPMHRRGIKTGPNLHPAKIPYLTSIQIDQHSPLTEKSH